MKHTTIALTLLLILLIPLLTGCAGSKIDPATCEIPEGWSIVSQENGVTHIRMNADSDNRVWIDRENRNYYFTNIRLAGDQPFENRKITPDGFIPVVLYIGCGTLIQEEDGGDYRLSSDHLDNSESYTLKMETEYYTHAENTSTSLLTLPDLHKTAKIKYNKNNNKIGYSEAVIVNVPLSIMKDLHDISVRFCFYDSNEHNPRGGSILCLFRESEADTVLVEAFPNAKKQTIQNSFPMVLFQAENLLNYGNVLLILAALLFTFLAAIRGKNKYIPYFIILAALGFNLIMTAYFDLRNTTNLDFSFLIFFMALEFYAIFTLGTILLYWIIRIVTKTIKKKNASRTQTGETT